MVLVLNYVNTTFEWFAKPCDLFIWISDTHTVQYSDSYCSVGLLNVENTSHNLNTWHFVWYSNLKKIQYRHNTVGIRNMTIWNPYFSNSGLQMVRFLGVGLCLHHWSESQWSRQFENWTYFVWISRFLQNGCHLLGFKSSGVFMSLLKLGLFADQPTSFWPFKIKSYSLFERSA